MLGVNLCGIRLKNPTILASGILGIASRTGSIIEVLGILQEFYEDEVKTKIRNLHTGGLDIHN